MTEAAQQKEVKPLISVNPDAVEPQEYFEVLKKKVKNVDMESLQKQLSTIASHLISAREAGQKSITNRLAFTYDVITNEQQLFASGYTKFVYQKDVETLLDKTKHIKIIELERFPRVVPEKNMKEILKAKKLGIFHEFVVVFTDLTDKDYKTTEEKEFVARNKDPVVFGMFRHKNANIVHDRMYFITDWEDEYCDLTFGKMIEEMSKVGIEKPEHEIGTDHAYITELVHDSLRELNEKSNSTGSGLMFTTNVAVTQPPKLKERLHKRFTTWFQRKST